MAHTQLTTQPTPVAHLSSASPLPPIAELLALVLEGLEAHCRLITWFGRTATPDEPAGVGPLSTQAALDLGLTGVVARASGIGLDVRCTLADGLYVVHPMQVMTESSGDCWARMLQRMCEAEGSTQWLIERLADTALNLTDSPDPFAKGGPCGNWALAPSTLVVSLIEGVRGPVMVVLETNAKSQVIHAKVQDPSLANWFGLAMALRGQQISDFPICNKSFDLSYCGNDL